MHFWRIESLYIMGHHIPFLSRGDYIIEELKHKWTPTDQIS